jgi:hypothetical protein
MVKTRVQCFFPVPNAPTMKHGVFQVYSIDIDITERDDKDEVKKEICIRTGIKFASLRIRIGNFNELLAFDASKMKMQWRLGTCGASKAVYEPNLLKASSLNHLGKSVTEMPDWDPARYDGRYDWVQESRPEWET